MGSEYDKRVVVALLLVCVNAEDILNHLVGDDVKNFISGERFSKKKNKNNVSTNAIAISLTINSITYRFHQSSRWQ